MSTTRTSAATGPADRRRAVDPAAAGVLRLQRRCSCGTSDAGLAGTCDECAAKRLQPKLMIGPTNDRYEQDADRVADAVLRAPGGGAVAGSISPLVQRTGTSAGAGAAQANAVPGAVHALLAAPGRPLDAAVRAYFEPRFGHDFSRVRVHHDAAAAASARAVARCRTPAPSAASTSCSAPEVMRRTAPPGRRLLAHELTHVVQQQGAVLRRASISPPVTGSVRGEEEPEPTAAVAPQPDDEEPLQRLNACRRSSASTKPAPRPT